MELKLHLNQVFIYDILLARKAVAVVKEHTSRSPQATQDLAASLGRLLKAGDVILLCGDLGAGKTEFVKGLATALAAIEPVNSPTFVLLNVYQGTMPIFHFDLYRLQYPEELAGIGFDEFIGGKGLAVVEWPDRFPSEMPDEYISVEIMAGETISERLIRFGSVGVRYLGRFEGSDLI